MPPTRSSNADIQDLGDAIQTIANRIYKLEQALYSPSTWFDPNPVFDTITIGEEEGFEAVILDRTVEKPTGVTATPGAYYDNIFVDVEWTNPSEFFVAAQIEIAEYDAVGPTYDLVDTARVIGNTHRFSGLKPNQDYAVRVNGVNNLGIFTNDAAWVLVTTGEDSTIPPAVTGVVLARGATSVIVKFTPLTEVQAPDVVQGKGVYRIEIDTVNTFDSGNLRTTESTSWVVAFNDLAGEATWYGRVAPIDSSGNQGPWANATSILAGGVNDSMIIADLSAAKITFGTMSGDRIAANTLDAATIKTSTLAATTITIGAGGVLKVGNPPTTGLFLNSQGISLYGGGVQKVFLDAATGNATFKGTVDASTITGSNVSATSISGGSISGTTITGGTFQTDTSGARLVIDSSNKERIKFYRSGGSLVGTIGYKSGGYGEGIYITSPNGVYVTDETGNLGTGVFAAYNIDANSIEVETLAVYNTATLPAITTDQLTLEGGDLIIKDLSNVTRFSVNYSGAVSAVNITTTSFGDFNELRVNGSLVIDSDYDVVHDLDFKDSVFEIFTSAIFAIAQGSGTSGTPVHANGINQLFRFTSSGRFKENVKPAAAMRNKFNPRRVHDLELKTWRSRLHPEDLGGIDDPNEDLYGLVAEEVYEVDPALVLLNEDGEPEGIKESMLVYYLLEEVQRLSELVES